MLIAQIFGNPSLKATFDSTMPSQLKQLRASLREQGIVGNQKSRKQKREALENIRDKFNPFEAKAPARGSKFPFVNARNGANTGRPGISKGAGEEAVCLFQLDS